MPDPQEQILVSAVAEAVVEKLDPRIERMERAILGDGSIGHIGLVERVRDLESIARGVDQVHGAIDERRIDGDKRLHIRLDEVREEIATKADHEDLEAIRRKLDRIIWMAAGVGLATGAGAATVARMFGAP